MSVASCARRRPLLTIPGVAVHQSERVSVLVTVCSRHCGRRSFDALARVLGNLLGHPFADAKALLQVTEALQSLVVTVGEGEEIAIDEASAGHGLFCLQKRKSDHGRRVKPVGSAMCACTSSGLAARLSLGELLLGLSACCLRASAQRMHAFLLLLIGF